MFLHLVHNKVFRQWLTAFILLLLVLHWGFGQAFSAVLVSELRAANSRISVSDEQISWIVSLFVLSMLFGSLLFGTLMELYGRRTSLQISYALTFVGWILMSLANNVLVLYISRILTGSAIGAISAAVVYITETNTPQHRVLILSLNGLILMIGNAISYTVGHFLVREHSAIVYAVTSGCAFLLLFVVPESPIWLLNNNETAKAFESLKWLRQGTDADIVNAEFAQLQSDIKIAAGANDEQRSYARKIVDTKAWKPFLILQIFFILQQLSGYSVLLYYNIQFYELFDVPVDTFVSSTGYGISSVLSFVIFCAIVPHFGRKTLTVISGAGICVAYSMAAVYEYWFADHTDKPAYWTPIICTWIGVAFSGQALGPLPWQTCGELLPSQVRGFLAGVIYMAAFMYMFILVKLFLIIVPLLKIYILLAVIASTGFASVLFGIFVLPETRGKTLADIAKLW